MQKRNVMSHCFKGFQEKHREIGKPIHYSVMSSSLFPRNNCSKMHNTPAEETNRQTPLRQSDRKI